MSDDDDWEFTALEEDKRTFPEIVIEVSGKSYADAVLQQNQCSKSENKMPHEVNEVQDKPTMMKLKTGRRHEFKRQSKAKKEEKFVAGILKRDPPPTQVEFSEQKMLFSLAEQFVFTDDCLAMMADIDLTSSRRMPYTQLLDHQSTELASLQGFRYRVNLEDKCDVGIIDQSS